MIRSVASEWLDQLAPSDPLAIGSRRDLRRVNFWMGNARIIARNLNSILPNPPLSIRLAELGSGDGTLLLEVARRLRRPAVELTLIDRRPAIAPDLVARFKSLRWKVQVLACDVFEALARSSSFDVMVANLFLHHFPPDELSRLLRLIAQKTTAFIACEPKRSRLGLCAQPLLRLLGCNQVTRLDAALSVRAGFVGAELSSHWPASGWRAWEGEAGLFSHQFLARRCAA